MKEISNLTVIHVISEPGDYTKYDYAYYRQHDVFYFMPITGSFKYPQMICSRDVKDIADETVHSIAKEYGCNVHTVMECVRTIQEECL